MGRYHSKVSTMAKTVLEHFPGYHTAKGGNCEGRTKHQLQCQRLLTVFSWANYWSGWSLNSLIWQMGHAHLSCGLVLLGSSTCCCISISANQNTLRSPRGSLEGYSARKQKTVKEQLQELPGTGSWVLLTLLSITNRLT